MKRGLKYAVAAAIAGTLILTSLTACSSVAPPDEVGLYYKKGPSDGNHFDHCYDPGTTTSYEWNNETILLPASLRTWNIAPKDTPGADSNTPVTVAAAPENGQPSGVQVNLWTQTNFSLNTFCGKDNNDPNSPFVQFWEKIGRRYEANTTAGWKAMLSSTIVTALETASRSVVRGYTADSLVSGTNREKVQNEIATLFQTEIKRVVGGEFFCAPTFDRKSAEHLCGEVQILLKDVDYTNPGIQAARDEKQAAVEKASAQVAEAQGKVDAAAKTGELYNNPAWVQIELAKLEKEKAEVCAKNPNCVLVIDGSSGGVNINAK